MTKSCCTFLVKNCFLRLDIEWESFHDFVKARDHIAKMLDAVFLYEDAQND